MMNSTQTNKEGDTSSETSLDVLARRTCVLLAERSFSRIDNVPVDLHPLPPLLPKSHWTCLGNAIKKTAENPTCVSIPGDHWISLRCDGTGFSKLTRRLRRQGVLVNAGWSSEFATIMSACCKELMDKFAAKCGYTQSDEMTVLFEPRASLLVGNEWQQQPHMYNGRVQKLCSLAASTVTSHFNHQIMLTCQKFGLEYPNDGSLLATFDCRVGMYKTREEAISLLMWRAYDCGVNGVSDAVYHCKGKVEGAGAAMKLRTDKKLQWLQERSLLPLQPQQRDGTFLVRVKRLIEAVDQKTNKPTTCLRSRIEYIPGNVLSLYKSDGLFPTHEAPE